MSNVFCEDTHAQVVLLCMAFINGKPITKIAPNGRMTSDNAVSSCLYSRAWQQSVDEPEKFWTKVAEKIHWYKKWDKVMDTSDEHFTKWFVGGTSNVCYHCLDLAVEKGFGNRVAIISDNGPMEKKQAWTIEEVLQKVKLLAGLLLKWGVKKGDRILVYMPMIGEGAVALLASARIGAVHCTVASDLPSKYIAPRIDLVKPKVVLMASHGYTMAGWMDCKKEMDDAVNLADHKPQKILIWERQGLEKVNLVSDRDFLWQETVAHSEPADCIPVEINEPALIIFTSGTSGIPKAVVHPLATVLIGVRDPTRDVGKTKRRPIFVNTNWALIAGPKLLLYTSLMNLQPSVIFEGDPLIITDIRTTYRILSEHKVESAMLNPVPLQFIRSKDPDGKIASQYNFESLKHVYVSFARTDDITYRWVIETFKCSAFNFWGQTEGPTLIAGIAKLNCDNASPVIIDRATPPVGWRPIILRDDMTEANPNEMGNLVMKLPARPGLLSTLYDNEDLCREQYFKKFPGYFDTKDFAFKDEEGLIKVICRSDDIMKIGFSYMSAKEVEEIVFKHPDVLECTVVSVLDPSVKEIPVVVYIPKDSALSRKNEVSQEILDLTMKEFQGFSVIGGAVSVRQFPRTRSGKIQRASLTALVRGQPFKAWESLENPEIIPELMEVFSEAGFGAQK